MIERLSIYAPIVSRLYNYLPLRFKNAIKPLVGPNDPPDIMRVMATFRGDTAVDVGANDGRTTETLLHNFRRVYAFEPFRNVRLERLGARQTRLYIERQALGSYPGEMLMYVRRYSIRTNQLTNGQPSKSWGDIIGTKTVPCTTLDAFFLGQKPPDFVKIDVEGFETNVIDGALKLGAANKTTWFIEIHDATNGGYILDRFSSMRHLILRHPGYPRGSTNWDNHYWLVIYPV